MAFWIYEMAVKDELLTAVPHAPHIYLRLLMSRFTGPGCLGRGLTR